MSGKRSMDVLDPDYQDAVEHQVKRQRVLEEDAKEASIQKIERITRTHFRMDTEKKEMEVKDLDESVHETRAMMDRLRAVVVASFYSRLQQGPGKMVSSTAVPLPSIHPTVKQHIGKAPFGMVVKKEKSDLSWGPVSDSSLPSSSYGRLANAAVSSSDAKQSSRTTSSAASTRTATSGAVQSLGKKEERCGSSRFMVKKTVIVGNVSRFILPHQREPNDQSTHKWMVYVRGSSDEQRIDSFVSKVWFFLHPSYRPNDLVEINAPPFHLTRRGWGVFPVRVQLHFWDPRNKPVDIIHNLKLDESYTGLQTLGAETLVEIEVFRDRPAPVTPHSSSPAVTAPSNQVIIEGVVKQEPEECPELKPSVFQTTRHCQCGMEVAENRKCYCTKTRETVLSGNSTAKRESPVMMDLTIKEEPPDDYEITDHSFGGDVVTRQSELHGTGVSGQIGERGEVEVEELDLEPAEQQTDFNMDLDESGNSTVCDIPHTSSHKVNKNRSASANVAGELVSTQGGGMFDQNTKSKQVLSVVKTLSSAILPKSSSVVSNTSSAVSQPTASKTLSAVSLLRPSVAQSVSLLSGSSVASTSSKVQMNSAPQRKGTDSSKPTSTSTLPVQVLLVDPSKLAGKVVAGTSLLAANTALTGGKPPQGKRAVAGPPTLLKVTPQGLQRVAANGSTGTLISDQPVAGGSLTPVISAQGGDSSAQPARPKTPVIGRESQSGVQISTSSSSSGVSSVAGMRSLLNTAAKPAIQALLQKRQSSGSFSASSTSQSSGNLTSSSACAAATTVSPRDSYIIANLNNRKVLMKIDGSSLRVQKGADSTGQSSGVTNITLKGTSNPAISAGVNTPVPVQFALQLKPQLATVQQSSSQKADSCLQASSLASRTGKPLQQPELFHTEGHKSQAGLELAKAKTALQGYLSHGITSKAAVQLAKLKAAMQEQRQAEPPKSRCAKWFSQGLSSSLASQVVKSDGVEQSNGCAEDMSKGEMVDMEVKATERWEEEAEKRIMVVKKLRTLEAAELLLGSAVADLSVEEYSDMSSLVKAASLRHPLLAPPTEKSLHPYSAASTDQWASWHPAKRSASEWTRASTVRKYLQRHLEDEAVFKGEQLWSTKKIMLWCRLHGLSPNGPGGCPLFEASRFDQGTMMNRKFVSMSDFHYFLSHFQQMDGRDDEDKEDDGDGGDDESDDPVDVEIVAVDPPTKKERKVKKETAMLNLDFDFLPQSAEAVFVQDTASQVGIKFAPAVLTPGVFASTAEEMIFASMLEFASDIVHQACSYTMSSDSATQTITSREVFHALKSLPSAHFLTRQYCGNPHPTSLTKR